MCGWQVKLCDPIVTQEPYLSALRDKKLTYKAVYKFICLLYKKNSCLLYMQL